MSEETHTTLLAHASFPVHYHWRSVPYAAKLYGKTKRRIRQMCADGTFAALDIPVYRDASNRLWIHIEEEMPLTPFE